MRPLLVSTRNELVLFLREPAALFFTLLLPLVLLVLAAGGEAGEAFVPGLLALVVATAGIMGLPETLASYRRLGVLRRLRAGGARPADVLGALTLSFLAVAAAGFVLLVAGAVALGIPAPRAPVALGGVALLTGACTFALALALVARASTPRTAQAVAAAVYFPMIFLSGAAVARDALPATARAIGDVLPLTWAVEALGDAWAGRAVDPLAVGALAAAATVGWWIALKRFAWD